jgi:hypothetical protein
VAGAPVTVWNVTCSPIATAAGAQCGIIQLRTSATVLWRAYVFFTATAAGQSNTFSFPINATYIVASNLNLHYSAITDATTAAAALVWN